MGTGLIIYTALSGIMTCWALILCIQIFLSGEEITLTEVLTILVVTFLFWWLMLLTGICYLIIERYKFKMKRIT